MTFLSFPLYKFSFSSDSQRRKNGRWILEKNARQLLYTPWKKIFVNLSWVSPCCEQKLGIGAQAMCIACNDTSVIVINFRKSKTHAITDTYCTLITFSRMFERAEKIIASTPYHFVPLTIFLNWDGSLHFGLPLLIQHGDPQFFSHFFKQYTNIDIFWNFYKNHEPR